jgi:hypothetical protein
MILEVWRKNLTEAGLPGRCFSDDFIMAMVEHRLAPASLFEDR